MLLSSLLFLPLLASPIPDDPGRPDAAPELALLQRAVEKTVAGAESSVACILVSRSEHYRKFEPEPSKDPFSGARGKFDAEAAEKKHPDLKRLIKTLDLSAPDTVPPSYGSGVVLDESGLILTYAHVVKGAVKIYVRFSANRGSWADIHALDPRSDLAVLRLLNPVPGLKAVKLGQGEKAKAGQFVILVASPYSSEFRESGPVADWALIGRTQQSLKEEPKQNNLPGRLNPAPATLAPPLHTYETLLQLDPATRDKISCSGGGVFNLEGELIGLTNARAALDGSESPGGFALAMTDFARRIIGVLRKGEEVEYGFLGVKFNRSLEIRKGVQLDVVNPDSPAHRGGLVAHDVILEINGVPISHPDHLFLYIGTHLAGNTIDLKVQSLDGTVRHCRVTLAKFYVEGQPIASNRPAPRRGLRVEYTSVESLMGGDAPDYNSVKIREIVPDSPASRGELKGKLILGGLIKRVNDQPVRTPQEFYREMDKATGPVRLTICRASGALPETITLEAK